MGGGGWGPGEGAEGESQRPSPFPGSQSHVIAYFKRKKYFENIKSAMQLKSGPAGFSPPPGFKAMKEWNFELRKKGSRNTKCVPL